MYLWRPASTNALSACHCDQLPLDQLPPMLTWAQAAREQLPSVLTELYGA